MPNRREFLQSGAAMAATAVLVSDLALASAKAADVSAAGRPYKAIYDRRFAAGRAFARAIANAPVQAIDGDLTDLYLNELDPRWRKAPDVIAGLTTQTSLVCLEHLARDYGMCVSYRGEHRVGSADPIRHDLTGPAHLLAHADAAQMRSVAWPDEVARLIQRYRTSRGGTAGSRQISAELPVPAEPDVEMLVSWVIGP